MGFHINGVAIDKKFKDHHELLSNLGLPNMQMKEESFFEMASSSLGEERDNDVFVTEVSNGTIITVGRNFNVQSLEVSQSLKNGQVLKFIVSEGSMAFMFEYFEAGKRKRKVLTVVGHFLDDLEDPLDLESETSDLTTVIFQLMKKVTGDNLFSIDPDHKSICYTISE
jgi:hypothetical protein